MIRTNEVDFTPFISVCATQLCKSCKKGTLVTNKANFNLNVEFICDTCFSVYVIGLKKLSSKHIDRNNLKAFKEKLKEENNEKNLKRKQK